MPCLKCGTLIDSHNIERWDGVTHMFAEDWECTLDNVTYVIKSGFITDGGSIPRFYRNVINPWGKYAPIFFIHDGLYLSGKLSRKTSDDVLRKGMRELDAGGYLVWKVHSAVRLFGGLSYKNVGTELFEVLNE